MTSYNQPNSDQLWWRYFSQFVSEMLHSFHQDSITCKCASQYMFSSVLLPWQHTGFQISPVLKAFLVAWHCILIFVNGASCAWSSKRTNMLSLVCGVVLHFAKSLTYRNQGDGGWKRVSCHGNIIFYSHRCVPSSTISLPNFNGLCCKLAKLARFINLVYNWVECMSS